MSRRLVFAALFLGLALLYYAWSPGWVGGMGYMAEEIRATADIEAQVVALLRGGRAPAVHWSRNGPMSLVLHTPFVVVAQWLGPIDSPESQRILALEPVLFTAGLVTLMVAWLGRLTGSPRRGLLLGMLAGFCTLLWPYAYIGLETSQSFFLFLTAFLVLANSRAPSWPRTLGISVAAAIAVCVKSTGAFLLPAVGFLLWRYFLRSWRERKPGVASKLVFSVVFILVVFVMNSWMRSFFWDGFGGTVGFISSWLVKGFLPVVNNLLGFLASPNKGLIVFAPVAILGLLTVQRVFRESPDIAIFALLVLCGLAGGFSLLTNWADPSWGPRYLHSAVAPLVFAYGAGLGRRAVPWLERAGLIAAALFGLYVSFLGTFFYYGLLHRAAIQASQSTLEALQFDPVWNHPQFNEMLFLVWLEEKPNLYWTPSHRWFFKKPADAPPWKSVNVSELAKPQPRIVTLASGSSDPALLAELAACAVVGFVLLFVAAVPMLRRTEDSNQADGPVTTCGQ